MQAEQIREYLKTFVEHHRSALSSKLLFRGLEDLVLRRGFAFPPPAEQFECPYKKPKQCFRNALCLSLYLPDVVYVEGYVFNILPFHHAWCADADGNVLEPTMREPGTEYFGVPLDPGKCLEYVESVGYYGVLANEFDGFPFLRGTRDIDEMTDYELFASQLPAGV